ncbi:armadillo-type protein [Lipomyces arxii]|uniref:armadillo-type protein n=1 Tax=Lipomyces arxii TaxID=56418 RepID=UPI0034D00A25
MDQQEDYSSLSLLDRATHKIWKVRLAAYEEMTKQFVTSGSEQDPCFRQFLNDPAIYKKIVSDSNVAAQEAGITSLVAILQYGGQNACQKLRGTVVAPLAEKGLVSMRAGTKQKTIDALLYFIEMDTPDPVVEELVPILSHKLPKLVAGTTMALREIIKAFGTKTVSPKTIVKVLPKLFAHSDKNVRAEATSLAVELYRWMGDALKPVLLPDLKPVQQKELEESFEAAKGSAPQQERFLLSQQQASTSAPNSGGAAGQADEEEEEEIDFYDMIETVDISSKIPGDFYDRMGSVKWKDRKEAVDDLLKVVSVPKIADSDFNELTRVLAKCVAKDANVAVVTTAANCVEALAKGLRAGFGRYKVNIFTSLLERLKEKKQSVVDALSNALDASFDSTTLADILEEILEFMKHKNPQVKQETTMFLVRCLRTVKVIPKSAEIKQMCDACTALLADTAKPVRSAAAEAMGTIMKMIGERAMTPFIDGLDDIRKNMIKEFFETATIRAKPEKAALPPAAVPKAVPPSSRASTGTVRTRLSAGAGTVSAKRPMGSSSSSRPSVAADSTPAASATSRLSTSGTRTSRLGSTSVLRKKSEEASSSPKTASPPPVRAPTGRGLTGVSLSTSTVSHNGLSAAEKLELAELRRAKEEWQTSSANLKHQIETSQSEITRLTQTINELQINNKQLIEDHTRDVLAVKAKETQLARARTEVDGARSQIAKLQRELENTRAQALVTSASASYADETDHKDGTVNSSPVQRRQSGTFISIEEKENGFTKTPSSTMHSRISTYSPLSSTTATSTAPVVDDLRTSGSAGSVESWRRAAEVTSQLKARIEAMKARQIRS